FFAAERPDAVVFAAAKVGGIHANNTYPAQFIYENLVMASNCIDAAYRTGTERFLFLGSTCIYPRMAPQPMPESCLLTDSLEPTNEAYAIAKIAGLKMCEFYRKQYGVTFHSAMPTNLYGPGDNYHPENSHVLPALIRRFHEAAESGADDVTIWGTGTPRREFLHVDDLARACVDILSLQPSTYWGAVDKRCSHVNVGSGVDTTIAELAQEIRQIVGFEGAIEFDPTKPDGAPQKLLDVSLAKALGWEYRISLRDGLERTVEWYQRRLSK
ncbi:MAG: GDP-L-fucose synthase, partial [Pseudomonadota bacterium]